MCERMDGMLELLRNNASTDDLLAELRDNFLDLDMISRREGHDILGEVVSCPKHVIYYAAKYIEMFQELVKTMCGTCEGRGHICPNRPNVNCYDCDGMGSHYV